MPERANVPKSSPSDDPMTQSLIDEATPLLAAIRAALAELQHARGRETLDRFFNLAPLEACVHLADVWSMAEIAGIDTASLRLRFDVEDQFLIDLVTTIYSAGRGTSVDQVYDNPLPELLRLVEHSSPVEWELSEAF